MTHIEEEFEKIESENGWNTLFRVSFLLLFFFDCYKEIYFYFYRNLRMIMVF
jgi:hypothetical protein